MLVKLTTFAGHETRVEYAAAAKGEPEETPSDEVDDDEAKEPDIESCAAYRLKFVPLDDETCRGARFDSIIPRADGRPRAGYDPLRQGDVLVDIDGACVVDLEYATILAQLRRPPPLALKFSRAAPPARQPLVADALSPTEPASRKLTFAKFVAQLWGA